MQLLKAHTFRSGRWWAIEYELDGRTYNTQAKNLNQVAFMVKDGAALMSGRPESAFEVEIVVDDLQKMVEECRSAAENVSEGQADAANFASTGFRIA